MHKRRILIVDDAYVSRCVLKDLLAEYGDCDVAATGEIAIKMMMAAYSEGAPYEVITMDIEMPGITGIETNEKIRKLEKSRGIPYEKGAKIIMVTAITDPKEIMASFREGCEWYVRKPVTKEGIEAALNQIHIEK